MSDEARCENCRRLQDVPHDATRIVIGGRERLAEVRCSLPRPRYWDRAGEPCVGPLQPRDCQAHPYRSHDDYWHGFTCTVPRVSPEAAPGGTDDKRVYRETEPEPIDLACSECGARMWEDNPAGGWRCLDCGHVDEEEKGRKECSQCGGSGGGPDRALRCPDCRGTGRRAPERDPRDCEEHAEYLADLASDPDSPWFEG